jgi:RNA polymerase sigma-32 factor
MSSEDGALDRAFVKRAMAVPLLDAAEERTLGRRIRNPRTSKKARTKAIEALVQPHLRLVVAISRKFRNYGLSQEDLFQEGFLGLMHAAERFDPTRKVRFATYAQWWIRSYMTEYVLRNWSMIRLGTTRSQKSLFFNLRRLRAQIAGDSDTLSPEEVRRIAKHLRATPAEVEAMAQRLSGRDSSLNAAVSDDGGEERGALLPDKGPSPEDVATAADARRRRLKILQAAVAALPERERRILEMRRLNEDGATLEEVGAALKVSKERVRQLEHRAIAQIRRAFEAAGIPPRDLLP